MAWCGANDVRNNNYKLLEKKEVSDIFIESQISFSEKIVTVDLSDVISKQELDSIGEESSVIFLLTVYKAVEKTLTALYGASRQIDEVSDIQYYQKQYIDLLKKIISGETKIIEDTTGENLSPKETPKYSPLSNKNIKLYPRKGVPDFIPAGGSESYKDN